MSYNDTILSMAKEHRVIAIVRGLEDTHMLALSDALLAGGIKMMEVTFDQKNPDSFQNTAKAIRALRQHQGSAMAIGAGTVLTQEQLHMAYDAGAQYIVTPCVNESIIQEGCKMGLAMFPGALTPTEIMTAYEAGASAVKVFPAGNMGAGYIKAIKAPLSHIPLIAVGGVNEKNAADFIKVGCVAIGAGGNLVNKEWIANGEWGKITALAAEFMQATH